MKHDEKPYRGRPLVIGHASIIDGAIFIDHPNDRERFNLSRLEGKKIHIKALPDTVKRT